MTDVEELLNMLSAVANEDYEEMLTYVPDGIEHRASKYKYAEDFEAAGSYEEDARYTHPAQWKLKEAVLRKAIELLRTF